jgi:hypothetical protein
MNGFYRRNIGSLPEHHAGRIAGQYIEENENQGNDAEKDEQAIEEPI